MAIPLLATRLGSFELKAALPHPLLRLLLSCIRTRLLNLPQTLPPPLRFLSQVLAECARFFWADWPLNDK